MMYHLFSFSPLSAHELVPYLVKLTSAYNSQTEPNSSTSLATNTALPWHICWLNNDSMPVIGLLPKVAWCVNPAKTQTQTSHHSVDDNEPSQSTVYIEIQKTSRQALLDTAVLLDTEPKDAKSAPNKAVQLYSTTYAQWIEELIDYSNQQPQQETLPNTTDTSSTAKTQTPSPHHRYQNGLMGFIGYDLSAKALSPNSAIALADQPSAFMAHYDIYLVYEKAHGWRLYTQPDTSEQAIHIVQDFLHWAESQLNCDPDQAHSQPPSSISPPPLTLQAHWHTDDYIAAFKQTQYWLYQGDSYQINLTQKWQGQLSRLSNVSNAPLHLADYLYQLHQQTQAPFAGYLGINAPNENHTQQQPSPLQFELLSCSPELFVVFNTDEQGEHHILTKPIKGTIPRGETPEQDEALKQQLANSAKDQAENVMIVDLLRNDLGRYAKTGSVQVPHLFAIESFSNVHHMVSSITATIKDDIHPLTVLFDSLPAGSITGTPKKRAVEIISELESGPRGAYCGTLGYMNFDGSGQWNVLIRSLQANQHGHVELWAGGGITVGSECAAEYQECKDKVSNLLSIVMGQ